MAKCCMNNGGHDNSSLTNLKIELMDPGKSLNRIKNTHLTMKAIVMAKALNK